MNCLIMNNEYGNGVLFYARVTKPGFYVSLQYKNTLSEQWIGEK